MKPGSKFLILTVLLTAALFSATALRAAEKPASKASGQYVGSDVCIGCHEDQNKRFKNTVMGKIFAHPRNELEKQNCESCHGAGKAHVDGGGDKTQIIRFGKDSASSPEEQNAACITCHNRKAQMFWKSSAHEARGMTCVGCHVIKGEKKTSLMAESRFTESVGNDHQFTKSTQTELCLDCHKMKRAQLQRSSHMPFREGKINCATCHNPHGSANPKQLIQATANENCLTCHSERRGPFLWEHAPVVENCLTCHDAHGSSNPQLLKTRQPRVCNDCHDTSRHPSQPQALNSKVYNRGCTNCHSQIHGSNHPSGNMYLR